MTTTATRRQNRPTSRTRKRAFAYLRVSSAGQVNTDYDPEGISLPAQRAAIQRRAAELDAEIVEEFVEPGRSATSTDKRPKFQEMMARLKAEGGIDYVIVYARSRLHRNAIDSAITKGDLRKVGATIISVMDYTEDSAIGDLVATVLDGVNEYQSRASGADIAYKMGQKAINGGCLGRAPIGYLNVRETFDGREVRTVAIDPDRAPLVRMAFELYATGTYTFRSLLDALNDAGLRTRPHGKRHAGRPLSIHKLGDLLRDRFYLGYVTYKDQEHPGRHEPLISEELFEKVQDMLKARGSTGTRERTHHHYLKGTVWCHRCKGRLIIARARSKTGAFYFYFMCMGRQRHTCDLPHLPVERVETAVLDLYATLVLPADLRARITARMEEALQESDTINAELHKRVAEHLAKLETQEDHFLDLIGDPDWPQEKIAARLHKIRDERARLAARLDGQQPDLATGQAALSEALDLLADPQELYRRADQHARQALNRTFFAKIYIDATDDSRPHAAADELTPKIAPLVDVARRPHDNGSATRGGTADLLRSALRGTGSSNAKMVEPRGLEPLTPTLPVWCATSCATAPFVPLTRAPGE